jgi:non-ribosomal peptide synthetase component F
MTLLAAFDLLLHHLSGQPDLVVGVHSAGQAEVGAKDLVGFCIQMLPVRSDIRSLTKFSEHLAQVRRHLTGAWEHRSLSLGRLVRRLGLRRDPGRPPLVDVVFNLDTAAEGSLRFHDLVGEMVVEPVVFAKFDMFWNLTRRPQDVMVECIYARDLFRPATVERWVRYYAALLRRIAERPDASLAAVLAAIPEADRRWAEDHQERLVRVRSQKVIHVRRRAIELERRP